MAAGPSDAAGQPLPVVEPEPRSAAIIGSSSEADEPATLTEPSSELGQRPETFVSNVIADGDSALGSISEPPEPSGPAGIAGQDEEPIGSEVRLIDSTNGLAANL